MPLKIEEPPVDVEAELEEFRNQWRVVRRKAKLLAEEAEGLVAHDGLESFRRAEAVYRQMYMQTYLGVSELIGLAVKLSPEARARVEEKVGPLFDERGAITQWWRDLWISEEVKEASRIRRLNDRSRT